MRATIIAGSLCKQKSVPRRSAKNSAITIQIRYSQKLRDEDLPHISHLRDGPLSHDRERDRAAVHALGDPALSLSGPEGTAAPVGEGKQRARTRFGVCFLGEGDPARSARNQQTPTGLAAGASGPGETVETGGLRSSIGPDHPGTIEIDHAPSPLRNRSDGNYVITPREINLRFSVSAE